MSKELKDQLVAAMKNGRSIRQNATRLGVPYSNAKMIVLRARRFEQAKQKLPPSNPS